MKIKFPDAKTIIVYNPVQTTNEIGETVNTYQNIGTIKAEIYPLTVNSTRGVMGITETSTHKLFTTDSIIANQKLQTPDGAFFIVQYVQDWDSHKEAVLQKVD